MKKIILSQIDEIDEILRVVRNIQYSKAIDYSKKLKLIGMQIKKLEDISDAIALEVMKRYE